MSLPITLLPLPKLSKVRPNYEGQQPLIRLKQPTNMANPAAGQNFVNEFLKFGLPLLFTVGLVILLANAAGQSATNTDCDKASTLGTELQLCKTTEMRPGPPGSLELKSL